MSNLLRYAMSYGAAGLSVIPIGSNKRPYWSRLPQVPDRHRVGKTRGIWQPFRWRRADEAQLAAWFGDGRANVGLVGGRISGGLLVLDFDHEAAHVFPAWQKRVEELAAKLPVVATARASTFTCARASRAATVPWPGAAWAASALRRGRGRLRAGPAFPPPIGPYLPLGAGRPH